VYRHQHKHGVNHLDGGKHHNKHNHNFDFTSKSKAPRRTLTPAQARRQPPRRRQAPRQPQPQLRLHQQEYGNDNLHHDHLVRNGHQNKNKVHDLEFVQHHKEYSNNLVKFHN
jgi:hypothetical protein